MAITFFGLIWCIWLSILFYLRDIESAIATLLFSMVLQCDNVIMLGDKGVGPQLVTSLAFIFLSFFMQSKVVMKKEFVAAPFLLLLSVFCAYVLINAILLKTISERFLDIAVLYVYLFASICLYRLRNHIFHSQIWNIILKLYVFLLVIGFFQLLATTKIIPKWLLTELLFNDTSELVYYHVKGFYARVTSTFMEPSYYSGLLCGLIGLLLYNKDKIKNINIYIVCGLIELVFTFSSTGYLTFVCLLFTLVFMDRSGHLFLKYLPLFVIIILFVLFSWDTLINEVIVNKLETGSGMTRQGWNLKALDEFYTHPIMGCGYIKVRASSLLLTILANLGIIGLALYLLAIGSCIYKVLIPRSSRNKLATSVRLILLAVFISQMIACPDLSLCTFWLCVYLVVVSDTKSNPNIHLLIKQLLLLTRFGNRRNGCNGV